MSRYDNLDSRDLIDRKEELEGERDSFTVADDDGEEVESPEQWAIENPEDAAELAELIEVCEEGEGYAPDWRYGETLIHESNFTEYVQDTVCEWYTFKGLPDWVAVDWEATAENVKADYTTLDYQGGTYYTRCC